jgi:acetyl esterase/lipase
MPPRRRPDPLLVASFAAVAGFLPSWSPAGNPVAAGDPDRIVRGERVAPEPAPGIVRHLDLPYAGDSNPRHRLDLLLPATRSGARLPVVLYLHSGGWVSGDKAEGARFLEPLVASGRFAGVSAGYRLADEARWPAQLHDAQAAVRWVRAHAERHGLDRERIGAWGWSAGGHLALMLGTTADVPELDGRLGPHRSESLRVAAVVNHAGISDLLAIDRTPGGRDPRALRNFASRLLGAPPRDAFDRAREASPLAHASAGDAPVFTAHGTADRTVPYDQAVRLHRALRDARVPTTFDTTLRGGHLDFPARVETRIREFLLDWLVAGPDDA